MVNSKSIIIFILTGVVLFGCSRAVLFEEEAPGESLVPVEFAPRISGAGTRVNNAATRVSDTEWELGDRLGVFMHKAGMPLQTANIIDNAENRCYEVSGSGASVSLVSAVPDYVMYYPVDGSEVDFKVYYPYVNSLTPALSYPIRINNQSDFAAIDLLYGTGTGSKRNKTVVIAMAHQLSKIRVSIRKAAELSGLDFSDTEVSFGGMPLASGFDLATATFDYLNEQGQPETGRFLTQTISEGSTYEAIVLPQPANQFPGREVSFALGAGNGDSLPYAYTWAIPDGTAFRPGKEYTYTFTLRAGSVEFAHLTISDWDDYSFEATAIEMVAIPAGTLPDGTEVEAFMMSRYPVTNAQYAAFLNTIQLPANGLLPDGIAGLGGVQAGELLLSVEDSKLTCSGAECRWRPTAGYEEHPVTGVSWYGAQAFAMWQGGSLPTETQWQYSSGSSIGCSEALQPGSPGGDSNTGSAYCFGNDVNRLHKYAWYAANNNTDAGNGIGTKEVGTRLMNAFTLYDMHGNVWEWCTGWYIHNVARSLRGGAYDSSAEECRSDYRTGAAPEETAANRGFRVVKSKK